MSVELMKTDRKQANTCNKAQQQQLRRCDLISSNLALSFHSLNAEYFTSVGIRLASEGVTQSAFMKTVSDAMTIF